MEFSLGLDFWNENFHLTFEIKCLIYDKYCVIYEGYITVETFFITVYFCNILKQNCMCLFRNSIADLEKKKFTTPCTIKNSTP